MDENSDTEQCEEPLLVTTKELAFVGKNGIIV